MNHVKISAAKVVYVPLGEKPNKKGEMRMVFARTGIRINMADGSWWFHHFGRDTWTHHFPGVRIEGRGFNARPVAIEKKDSYTPTQLEREYRARLPELLTALDVGEEMALAEEAAKRAG